RVEPAARESGRGVRDEHDRIAGERPVGEHVLPTRAHERRHRMTPDDERHLLHAVDLAVTALASGDAPFGSLLVSADGTVLAEERNTVLSDNDITAHPELKLARWAAQHLATATAA